MKRHTDVVINQFQQVVSGASVTVKLAGTNTLANIYSDDGITPTTNPTLTDAFGRFFFYVADGRYDLVITKGTIYNYTLLDQEVSDTTQTSATDQNWVVSSGQFQIGLTNKLTFFAAPTTARSVTFPDASGTVILSGSALSGPSLTLTGATSGSTVLLPLTTASGTLTVPSATDTLVARATTDTLQNKTLSLASNTLVNSSNVAGHVLRNNGTSYVDGQVAAADLANGTTGSSGAVVLANTPTISSPVFNGTPTGSALQGTDTKLLTAGTFAGGAGKAICTSGNGGATTSGCGASIIQTVKKVTGCSTGGGSNSACQDTLTWPVAFADTGYVVTCQGQTTAQFTGQSTTNMAAGLVIDSYTTTTVTTTTETFRSLSAQFSEIHCIGIHP